MTSLDLIKGKYGSLRSVSEIRATLEKQGFAVFPWQDRSGAVYDAHSHPHDEYIVVASGQIVFTIGAREYLLEAGDVLVLPAGTVHSAVNRGRQSVHYFICTRS